MIVRAGAAQLRVLLGGVEVARHTRSYDRGRVICLSAHQLQALQKRKRLRTPDIDIKKAFDELEEPAHQFHRELCRRPVKTAVHLRRLLDLVRLYGQAEVVAAVARANEYQTYDAAYVETILLHERRRREVPSPTQVRPQRAELIPETDLEEPDSAAYDRLCDPDPQTDE